MKFRFDPDIDFQNRPIGAVYSAAALKTTEDALLRMRACFKSYVNMHLHK